MISKAQYILFLSICALAISCASQKNRTPVSSSKTTNDSDMPAPPKDAQYTIYCQVITGPDHLERSRNLRQVLKDSTPLKDWYVVHATNQSTLYYGFYRNIDPRDPTDGEEGARALRDLHSIRTMVDARGQNPFSASLPVLIDAPDPSANPAWDLARSNAMWSLEIAVYKDSPDRKQAAVDAVRAARAQGIEAYYYHGSTSSCVCIGAWPAEAVHEVNMKAQNDNPDAPLYVTAQPLSEDAAKSIEARGIKPIAPQVQLVDPTLTDTMRRFPEHAINGEVRTRRMRDATGHEIMQPESSYLVKGPFTNPDEENTTMAESAPSNSAVREMPPESEPGVGKLKSIGN